MIEQVRTWLSGQPGLEEIKHKIIDAVPGEVVLNCFGQDVLWEKEDILGGKKRRLRLQFGLGRHTTEIGDLEIYLSLNQRKILDTAPTFGEDQTVKVEQGRTVLADNEGVIRMEALLTFEYTKEEH